MSDGRRRIEPTIGEARPGDRQLEDERPGAGDAAASETLRAPDRAWFEPDPALEHDPAMRPMVKWALFAITLACLVFAGDRLLTRYQEARAMQALEAGIERFSREMAESAEQARAQQAARTEAVRRQRAQTVEGRWLAKNCQDWTASFRQLKAETAEQEMRLHCGRYERYLATGRVPPGTPR